MNSYDFMNEGSPRSYQSSKSVPTATVGRALECEQLERCSGGTGCCRSGFMGFESAWSPLSTNQRHGAIWLLPLVVGSPLIISLRRQHLCETPVWLRVPFLRNSRQAFGVNLRHATKKSEDHVCPELQRLMFGVLAQSQGNEIIGIKWWNFKIKYIHI